MVIEGFDVGDGPILLIGQTPPYRSFWRCVADWVLRRPAPSNDGVYMIRHDPKEELVAWSRPNTDK